MTSITLGVFEHLLAEYGAILTTACGVTVTTSQGYPVWGKPEFKAPCVALAMGPWQPDKNRTGAVFATGATGYRGWLFARHEPELCEMKDALVEWHKLNGGAFEIAARRIATALLKIERHDPEADVLPEFHAADFFLQAIW